MRNIIFIFINNLWFLSFTVSASNLSKVEVVKRLGKVNTLFCKVFNFNTQEDERELTELIRNKENCSQTIDNLKEENFYRVDLENYLYIYSSLKKSCDKFHNEYQGLYCGFWIIKGISKKFIDELDEFKHLLTNFNDLIKLARKMKDFDLEYSHINNEAQSLLHGSLLAISFVDEIREAVLPKQLSKNRKKKGKSLYELVKEKKSDLERLKLSFINLETQFQEKEKLRTDILSLLNLYNLQDRYSNLLSLGGRSEEFITQIRDSFSSFEVFLDKTKQETVSALQAEVKKSFFKKRFSKMKKPSVKFKTKAFFNSFKSLSKKECCICEETSETQSLVRLNCQDVFCKECLCSSIKMHLHNKSEKMPCPNEDCNQDYYFKKLEHYLTAKEKKKLREETKDLVLELDKVKGDRYSSCPRLGCTGFILNEKGVKGAICYECHGEICKDCNSKENIHFVNECLDSKTRGLDEFFIDGLQYKRCPRCKKATNRTEGCNHMTCICRYEWHWPTRKEWEGYGDHQYTHGN